MKKKFKLFMNKFLIGWLRINKSSNISCKKKKNLYIERISTNTLSYISDRK